jgi:hypothetical protein
VRYLSESLQVKIPSPLPLRRSFDDPNWIYEIEQDGFRALAVMERWELPLSPAKGTNSMASAISARRCPVS